MAKSASALRRMRRMNIHPIYGTKLRKGNKGSKLDHLQVIVVQDNTEDYLDDKHNVRTSINRCILKRVKTIYHWKQM